MISCAIIERPGRWRWAGLVLVFAIALAPVLPAVLVIGQGDGDWLDAGFGNSLLRSFAVAGAVSLVSLAVGLPGGVLAGLYRFPLRRAVLALLLLPLVAPPFLWALGLSMLRIRLGQSADGLLSGFSGTVLAFVTSAYPLVFFAALLATRGLSRGQVDGARVTGGERRLFHLALRHALPVALLASLLAAVLTVSEPGAGQILGYEGAASQILVSFAATYDFPQAARQSLVLTGLILIASLPLVIFAAPRLSAGLLGRASGGSPLLRHRSAGILTLAGIVCILTLTFGLAFAGLSLPALAQPEFGRAWQETARTLPDTLFYAIGAGFIAALAGCLLAFCAGSQPRLRTAALGGLLVILALPPSLGALGLVTAASDVSSAWDGVLRSRITVILWLSARLFPIAALFALRRLASMSPMWAMAAAIPGVPLRIYLLRVIVPWLWPVAAVSALLAGLLAIGDISSMLLLHPPGNGSLPLAIFTVMANAPESLVASLCLIYVMGFAVVLAAAAMFVKPNPLRK
jgi:iron(III) transport system permease protein